MLFNILLVIVLSMSGEYYCEEENGTGTDITPPKHLVVQYPPESISVSVSSSGEIVEGRSVTLTCSSDANPPVQRYTWYKNNKPVSSETEGPEERYTIKNITLQDAGEYYCEAGNGIETNKSPPKHLDVQYPPKSVSVSLNPTGKIVEGSSVTLICSSDANPPVLRYTWYRKGGSAFLWRGSERSNTINKVNSSDAGEYYCEADNGIGTNRSPPKRLGVQYPPKSISVSVPPSGEIVEGSSVTLTCSSSDANPPVQQYTWYRKGVSAFLWRGSERSYTINKVNSWDAGEYYCEADNGIGTNRSPPKHLDVQYAPKNTLVSVPPSGEIVEGSSVTLICSSDANPPVLRYTWYRKGGSAFLWRGSERSYTINKVNTWDAGEYYCEAGNGIGTNRSPPKRLGVQYPPKSVSLSVSPSREIKEGSSVTLTCMNNANPPVQKYTWYKNRAELSWRGSSYTIKSITLQNAGEYYCAAQNVIGRNTSPLIRLDVLYPPKSVSVSAGKIVEGSSVTLTCSSDANPPVKRYTWYKNNRTVSSETGGPVDSYTIKNITLQDAGEYYCEAGNGIGRNRSPPKRLDVQYPPKSVSVSVSPSGEIMEGRSVTLTCSSSDANPAEQKYAWYKKTGFVFSRRGSERSYTIKSITLQDAGEYYCEAENAIGTKRSPTKHLDVQYRPMSVSVSVSPSGEIKEGSSVTLTCSSDANPPVQNYTWFRKNDTGAWQAGSGQSLNFSNFGSWNRGQYYCEAQNRLGAQNASALLVLIQDLQTGSARIVSFSNFTSWIFGQYYCVALNTHGDQTSAAEDKTALVWRVVGITVAFALFTVMVCTSRKKSTNRERGRSRHSRTSRAFRE